jgi:hypothetical protein
MVEYRAQLKNEINISYFRKRIFLEVKIKITDSKKFIK